MLSAIALATLLGLGTVYLEVAKLAAVAALSIRTFCLNITILLTSATRLRELDLHIISEVSPLRNLR